MKDAVSVSSFRIRLSAGEHLDRRVSQNRPAAVSRMKGSTRTLVSPPAANLVGKRQLVSVRSGPCGPLFLLPTLARIAANTMRWNSQPSYLP